MYLGYSGVGSVGSKRCGEGEVKSDGRIQLREKRRNRDHGHDLDARDG